MGISIWQLLIILLIVLVLFGAKRLRNVGSDLGAAIKGFKQSLKDEEEKRLEQQNAEKKPDGQVFDAQTASRQESETTRGQENGQQPPKA